MLSLDALLLLHLLQDDINRQNAAYCSGLLVQASPEDATQFMPQLLTALHNMFRSDEAAGAQDNAVGAVGRIMTAVPEALPLGQVLPVLLSAMPLKVGGGAEVVEVGQMLSLNSFIFAYC